MEQNVQRSAEVVICGAGMAGVCTAYWLARAGMHGIVLIDCQFPLTLTSDKSAETYRVWWPGETNTDKFGLLDRSVSLIEGVVKESNGTLQMMPCGHCHVTMTAEKAAMFRSQVAAYATLDQGPVRIYDSRSTSQAADLSPGSEPPGAHPSGVDLVLDGRIFRESFSYLSADVRAIIHDRRSGFFSGHTLGMYLREKAKDLGVQEVRAKVVAVDQDSRGVCAVRTARGDVIQTRRFVNASGPFVRQVTSLLQVDIPVETGMWEKMVIADYLGVMPRSAPVLVLHDRQRLAWSQEERDLWTADEGYRWFLDELPEGVYMRPEGGLGSQGFLIGWAYNECPFEVEVDRTGQSGRTGAGAACEPRWEPQLSPEFPDLALHAAAKMVPGLAAYYGRLHLMMHDGGCFVRTRGNIPLIGPIGVEGAYVVQHDGMVMAGCAAGELCAAWVTGSSSLPPYARGLSLQRYKDGAAR